jgi:signal transduction histidine kinase
MGFVSDSLATPAVNMPLDSAERLYLEKQVSLARATFAALALVDLLVLPSGAPVKAAAWYLGTYLLVAVTVLAYETVLPDVPFQIPVVADLAALAVFLVFTPSISAWWFLFLFAVFSLATQQRAGAVKALVILAALALSVRVILAHPVDAKGILIGAGVALGTLLSGFGMGFLASRQAQQIERHQFLEKLTGLLHFDRGLTESVRQALGEIALAFNCEQACLAVRDEELERLFVWKIHPNDRDPGSPETLPLTRAETFLTDAFEVSFCWEFADEAKRLNARGFGWDRRTGRAVRTQAPPPDSTRVEFNARTLMAVTIDSAGRPAGRVLLINPKPPQSRFSKSDLRWFEQVVRHVASPLENVFLMRHLRARAVEAERSRMSRDLHDGILQTLLSLNIQLDVLRNKFPWDPDKAGTELETLQKTVQLESQELRRMVTELRPLRVESADMRELMLGFAERYRMESNLAVDLFIEDRDLRVPDRICRELFQIYRESLNNIKKHAKATHVVVKLGQDDSKVSLVVDDNGQGFSFSGLFASEDLDRLRLGPISIKERTRSVGGTLTVESNPGHGARLTVEIPLN